MKSILESLGIDPFSNEIGKKENAALKQQLPQKPQFSNMIYLDYAATTPVAAEVIESMVSVMESDWANVSSPHELGVMANQSIEKSMAEIAAHFNVARDEIIITSGATESINHALKGLLAAQKKKEIITSTIEHKATINTVQALMKEGYRGKFIAPNVDKTITPEMIQDAITSETAIISLIWVNNETGDKLPVEAIAKIAREHKIPIHIDATQAAPHFQFDASQFDLVSLSAHKCYGPKGVGLLYRRNFPKLPMLPLIDGSGGQLGLRAGTMANEQVVGFAKSLQLIAKNWSEERHRLVRLESLLLKRLLPYGLEVNSASPKSEREPGVLNLYIPNVHADALMALTPKLAIAKGSACNSDDTLPSYVLTEMGYDDRRAFSSIRISVGRYTTEELILSAGDHLATAIEFLQNIANGKKTAWYGEYNLYDRYMGSCLEPNFIEHNQAGMAHSHLLLDIDEPHFSFKLWGEKIDQQLDDGKAIRFENLSGAAFGAPFYLALFNDLVISLRDESISSTVSIENLLGVKIPANYLRDVLAVEKGLRSLV